MKRIVKPGLSILALALGISACSTAPFTQKPAAKPVSKAPVVDRTARRQPAYPAQPLRAPQSDVGRIPQEDPLLPREYSSTYPAAPNEYDPGTAPPTYPNAYGGPAARPYPNASGGNQQPAYPPASGEAYRPPPAYPPGAAAPYPPASRPMPGSLPEPQPAVIPPTPRVKPLVPADTGAPAPADTTVAMTTPPPAPAQTPVAPPAPAPRPAQPAPPPPPPADLPPAEISRDGNQAVVALLESADKYVKSNQLDKAGAALERALRIEPRNAGIWHDLAQIRLHQGQYQQAESLASKSNNLAGSNRALQSRNWKLIGSARKAGGNAAGAEEAEARASQLSR